MLQLDNVSVRYGGLAALTGISMEIRTGEFVSIVGSNGAGKSTLFKAISGTVPLSGGTIRFDGGDLAAIPSPRRPHLGIAHVPENRLVFSSMTVLENLELGTYCLADQSEKKRNIGYAMELFPILHERRSQLAGTLSGGQQQMLSIARGLVSSPRLLMLDEPSMGIAPAIVDQIFERIKKIHAEQKITIVLVEQRAIDALDICDRAYVLATGHVVATGNGRELLANNQLKDAYFGT